MGKKNKNKIKLSLFDCVLLFKRTKKKFQICVLDDFFIFPKSPKKQQTQFWKHYFDVYTVLKKIHLKLVFEFSFLRLLTMSYALRGLDLADMFENIGMEFVVFLFTLYMELVVPICTLSLPLSLSPHLFINVTHHLV